MNSLENIFLFLDYLTDTQRKRHMIGGVLMSVSLFFRRACVHPDDRQRRRRP